MIRRNLHRGILPLCFILLPAIALAQSDTTLLTGYVRDESSSSVPNAGVAVKNEATGLERRVSTNESGYFVAGSLTPGFYTVTIEAPGFKRFVSTGNKLDPNVPARLNATLELGALTQSVEVAAAISQVQSQTAALGKLIESSQIQDMMLNGRNPVYLALLKPGVSGPSLAGFSFGLEAGNNQIAINGARTFDSATTYDGAVAVRTRGNAFSIGVVDVDAVQEIQVLTGNYSAEYGRSSGGQIRVVTRSGARDFHGALYDYLRNDKLDANTWARNRTGFEREASKFNQFGYNFSGPVFLPGRWNKDRNKLFFFWSQEWVRFRQEQTSIQAVPSLAMRRGDFSELLDPANFFFSRVRAVNDPLTNAPFPGNVIPASRLSRNGQALLRVFPEPVPGFLQGRNNFIQTQPQPENQRKDTLSMDFLPVERHMFRFRHQNYSWKRVDAFKGGTDRAPTDWDRPNKTASVNYIWTVSPSTVNEFLASVSVDRVYTNITGPYQRSKYGVDYPYLFPEGKDIYDKIPTIDVANFVSISAQYPVSSAGMIYQVSDNLSRNMGSHLLKFGGLFERSGQNDFEQLNVGGVPGGTNNQAGRFVFDDRRSGAATTGLAAANAAMGLFTTYAEIGPRSYTPYRGHMFEWFVQDSWKATQRLTVEMGLRHTIQTPYWFSLWRNMALFDPSRYNPAKAAVVDRGTGNILSGELYNGVVIPGNGWTDAARGRIRIAGTGEYDYLFSGGGKTWGKRHLTDFQPRVGLAYAINPKTVIRSGAGRFYSRQQIWDNISIGGNPPFQPMASIANGVADSPGGGTRINYPLFYQTFDPVLINPSAWQWNVTIEREVGFRTLVEVSYVGRVGLHMERVRELNQLAPGTLQDPANRGVNVNALRPYKGFAFINMGEYGARSEYNSLQIGVNRRFAQGLSYGLAYTYAKSMDNASNRREQPYNSFDDRAYWGLSAFDRRHVAVINFIYEAPFWRKAKGLRRAVLGGWQVTGITQFQTGAPFGVGTGEDFAGIGSGNQFQLWEQRGDPHLPRPERRFSESASDQNFYFRTTAGGQPVFTPPAAGTFSGTQTRNTLNNVGFQNWNLALFKHFPVREKHQVEFRGELFNWINHPNWSAADTNPRSGTFGKVSGKAGNRNVQLSLRYSF